ncbi:helix-turn-helix transcriptional regulator [Allosphingosinicella flava]|uniref:Helix-turn-helix transcriptional regulator n=1 Tax=Allosphingosinicella flava TaxID=2771430 RepID=A0A7T2GI80_9SPHN|nr:helix-turn-helix transcriptional regulator [Sphingosinicella flava]QPQ54003.1 helix-turn-helix transcriptional regulator [Sphingosinicella flava]
MDVRTTLQRLIEERREDYAGLSRMLGRNPAYMQQFIKRGTPRKLAEDDRRLLARYFGVPESLLGAPDEAPSGDLLVSVPRLDIGASAGPGAFTGDEQARNLLGFDKAWLRTLTRGDPSRLSMIRVEGDSMVPTLSDGDDILVDGSDGAETLRDGIYVLRVDGVLMVKRIAMNPAARRVSIVSDNAAYPGWPDCALSDMEIVGRVVWVGRPLR